MAKCRISWHLECKYLHTSSPPSSRHLDSVPVFGHDTVIVTRALEPGNCPDTSIMGSIHFPQLMNFLMQAPTVTSVNWRQQRGLWKCGNNLLREPCTHYPITLSTISFIYDDHRGNLATLPFRNHTILLFPPRNRTCGKF